MKKKHIVILGAGISGLSLGWFLKNRFNDSINLTIVEQSDRVGGWIRTVDVNGFHFELGPHSFRLQAGATAALDLVQQLGIQDQILWPHPSASKRYLLHKKQLLPLPRNPLEFISSPLMKGILRALWHDWRHPREIKDDETIYDFISRRLSSDIAERLVDPLVSGIYAGDMRQLSLKSCFPRLFEMEQKFGSIVSGMMKKTDRKKVSRHELFSLRDGMESLPKELYRKLQEHVRLNTKALALDFTSEATRVQLSDGENILADHVFSTLPSRAIGELIAPHQTGLGNQLQAMPSASVVVVNLGFRDLELDRKGFGYLVPSCEDEDILGVIWDSCVFPEQNRKANDVRLTVMMGGAKNSKVCALDPSKQLNLAMQSVKRHLNVEKDPRISHVHLAKDAIPQYHVGHEAQVKWIKATLANLSGNVTLLGTAFDGVSINDCIAQAELQAKMLRI